MGDAFEGKDVPKGALYGAGALILFTLIVTFVGKSYDVGKVSMPDGEPLQTRVLRFEDRASGAVAVFDADSDLPLAMVAPGEQGFLRGVLRGMMRERHLEGLDREAPLVLTRWSDGRLSIRDPSTERAVELDAFGPDNVAAFRVLMDAKSTDPRAEVSP